MKNTLLVLLFLASSLAASCVRADSGPLANSAQKPDATIVAKGSTLDPSGQLIEVREYETKDKAGHPLRFWLCFCNGTLIRWGKAGDWAEAQKKFPKLKMSPVTPVQEYGPRESQAIASAE